MSEPGFTPGPWQVFICDDGKQWTGWPLSISATNEADKLIVRPGGQWPYEWDAKTSQYEACANARLIAAAPELYEALRDVLDSLGALGNPNELDRMGEETAKRVWAALAKAEGKSG